MTKEFTHIDKKGKIKMVDVSSKPMVKRIAVAEGRILLQKKTIALLKKNGLKKGDALTCAKIAGICGAKKTPDLIPLCHNLSLDHIDLDLTVREDGVIIRSTATCIDKTGVEMEALTAVSIAALTVYDMCKAVDKKMIISDIRLIKKKKEIQVM